jgi:hypothetical protein
MQSTWESRDLVVLEAAVKSLDEHAGNAFPTGSDLQELTGLSADDVKRSLLALDGAYLEVRKVLAGGSASHWRVVDAYPNARLVVGQWPTPEALADRLTQALATAADNEPDEEKRGWLKKTAAWLGSAGRDVAVDVASSVIAKSSGLG